MPFPAKTSAPAIFAAALALLEAEGAEALSMRGLAQHLKLAPNALYRYFPNREALLAALGGRAAEDLCTVLAEASSGLARKKALRALAAAYLGFARQRPHLYAIVVLAEAAGAPPADAALQTLLRQRLEEVVDAVHAPKAAATLWGYLHGMAGLERAGLLRDLQPDASLWGFEALLKGLKRIA
jgi:AcrR family transcriptional regulator